MASVKSIPIKNADGQVVSQRFEASESFKNSIKRTSVPMVRPDGKTVNVNRKLAHRGNYTDKGYTEKRSKAE
jgi:hypothetical protein